mmetsp:Transcript_2434/g.5754  ORF Transcript_2434/g.5754 Transcript_2434/m.5754 type:complete len:128 (-) Transcript_2434:122-505(-)
MLRETHLVQFQTHMQAHNQRQKEMEQRYQQNLAALKSIGVKKVESLEEKMNSEMDKLDEMHKTELTELRQEKRNALNILKESAPRQLAVNTRKTHDALCQKDAALVPLSEEQLEAMVAEARRKLDHQ